MNIIKKRINDLLYENSITQTGLAEHLGITQATLSRNLNGEHGMRIDVLKKIADYFNVSTDYLLGRTENKSSQPQIIEKVISISSNNKSPLATEPVYQEVLSLIDRLTKNELFMLKGMIMAILGNEAKDREKEKEVLYRRE